MSKKAGSIFEIRPGVYAFGEPGKKAVAVVAKDKGGPYAGVRGVKPTIHMDAKPAEPAQGALDVLARLVP